MTYQTRRDAAHAIALLLGLCVLGGLPAVDAQTSPDGDAVANVPDAAQVCLSCHAIAADEPALEGPTLWGVVGRRIASAADFEYSDALRRQQGDWDRAKLDRFLAAPQAFAPGTQMTLGGVRNAADRAAVIDFLETLR
jgi:cytochrome c